MRNVKWAWAMRSMWTTMATPTSPGGVSVQLLPLLTADISGRYPFG